MLEFSPQLSGAVGLVHGESLDTWVSLLGLGKEWALVGQKRVAGDRTGCLGSLPW